MNAAGPGRRVARFAAGAGPAAWNSDQARSEARDILSESRFHDREGSAAPRPFRGPVRWLGDRLDGPIGWVGDRLHGLVGWLDRGIEWLVDHPFLGGLVVAATAALVVTLALRGRARRASGTGQARVGRRTRLSPDVLEQGALDAYRAGDYEKAIRLWFVAGLLRLDRAGRIRFDPALTTGDVARSLHSPSFQDIGARFDEIVYGRRPPRAEDVEATRDAWALVLAEKEPHHAG